MLFIGHVDNGTHTVAVVPHDNPFRWLRPRDGIVRELGADVHVRTNEAPPVKQAPRTAAPDSPKSAAGAPSGILGLASGADKDGNTASRSRSQTGAGTASTVSKSSFGPEALHVKVPLVAVSRDSLRLAIAQANVRSGVSFQLRKSNATYLQFICSAGASCSAFLVYSLSSNGLILNEKKSNLVHSCRSDSAQEAAKEAQSEKKWSRSKLTIKQLLQLAETCNIDVTQHGKAKSFLNAILGAAKLGDAKVGNAAMYNLFKAAKKRVSGASPGHSILTSSFFNL